MMIVVRLLAIMIASAALGVGYIELYQPQLDWVPSKEVRDKEGVQRENEKDANSKLDEIIDKTGIDLIRFQELLEAGALVIDNRSAEEFEAGHLDTPLIANLTPSQMIDVAFYFEDLFLSEPQFPIVMYCRSIECKDSKTAYVALENAFLGMAELEQVYIYLDGWEGIQSEGLPILTGAAMELSDVLVEVQIYQQMAVEVLDTEPNQEVTQ